VKARYLCRDDSVARKMYHKLKNVSILIENAITADIRTREQVIDSGPMCIYKTQYSHREHDNLTETKQRKTKIILWFHNTKNIKIYKKIKRMLDKFVNIYRNRADLRLF